MVKKRKTKKFTAKKTKVKRAKAKKTKVKRTRTSKKNKPERQPNQDAGTPEHITEVSPTPAVLGPNSATDL
jgi:hypothetical protein